MEMFSAYTLPTPTFDAGLTQVGRGTPMGELLRRYWHPVAVSADACETPRIVTALGERLVLFRDGEGRPGLLHERCAHRGTSLYYGKVDGRGIRCCYHGWLFDVDGKCVEQPCEPAGGARTAGRVRQPGYPVQELYGLIFAYMGPPENTPVLPRYDVLEELAPGEFIEADDTSLGSGGPAIVPCNWLQHFENVMDPFHVPILHGSFSGNQFVAQMALMPEVLFEETERGIQSTQVRDLGEGKVHRRITEAVLPTIRAVANPRAENMGPCSLLGWVLPIDDTSFRIYSAGRVTEKGALARIRSHFNGKLWHELTEEEHRTLPGDYEAQVGQGAITFHSEEHLVTSDKGIGLLRRYYRRQIERVAAGDNPIGTRFEGADPLVRLAAGIAIVAAS
ncbi:aromatic ring-hydroxylating dioxygenase subunit alpha [Sphingomonas sp. QA11]|uniref:aromatic ring-hydroxylating dioxygenase subunit alpha n=1 Tax=Sphingomonas sp. QA11 TaxID=2950605 RepID=UPI00234ABD9B|nr:aromatic ring-hydroxylating dioxygenase subunit alpha [Sphingomonas sp. QA11]WCM29478.1 aromatic ring-hydroxylating dioxygenase subunit alpha [Sphingomonas sp. QA11]